MGKSGEAPRITAEVRRDKLRPNKIFPPRPDNGPSRLRCKNLKAYLLLLCGEFLIFFVITFIVSNFYENLSILTGFPFGHYHYTETLGPKLFLVPLLIAPAYFGCGYLAWSLAHVLVGAHEYAHCKCGRWH